MRPIELAGRKRTRDGLHDARVVRLRIGIRNASHGPFKILVSDMEKCLPMPLVVESLRVVEQAIGPVCESHRELRIDRQRLVPRVERLDAAADTAQATAKVRQDLAASLLRKSVDR